MTDATRSLSFSRSRAAPVIRPCRRRDLPAFCALLARYFREDLHLPLNDEQAQELYVASENYDYTVHRIVKANADSFMRELFETGKVDLTQFEASADK